MFLYYACDFGTFDKALQLLIKEESKDQGQVMRVQVLLFAAQNSLTVVKTNILASSFSHFHTK